MSQPIQPIEALDLAAVRGGLRPIDCDALERAYPEGGPRPTDPNEAVDRALCAWSKGKPPPVSKPDKKKRR